MIVNADDNPLVYFVVGGHLTDMIKHFAANDVASLSYLVCLVEHTAIAPGSDR